MKRIIKELKNNYKHELDCVIMTPCTDFKGTQKQHEDLHKKRAQEYLEAIKILSSKFEVRGWLPPSVENFTNYKKAKKYYDNYIKENKGIADCDVQLLAIIEDVMIVL